MADRVLVHIGLPKTATTYLQTILWEQRPQLRADGVLLPGAERRDHLWSSRIIREDPAVSGRPEEHRTAWERVRAEIDAWPQTALISHEFFAAASVEQARRMVADLAPAQVELVVTAREPLGLFVASWQESLKNRHTWPLADYPGPVSDDPLAIWNWRTLDLDLVLERWTAAVPAERIHVLPLPGKDAPRDLIWQRFATLLGIPPERYSTDTAFANSSMGVVEAETLRRINERLVARGLLSGAFARGTMIRTFLADERLVSRGGDAFWPEAEQVEDCRRRAAAWIAHLDAGGYDVVGDSRDLAVPEQLPDRRTPASVATEEMLDVATDLVAQLTGEVHRLRQQRAEHADAEPGSARAAVVAVGGRVRERLRRRSS